MEGLIRKQHRRLEDLVKQYSNFKKTPKDRFSVAYLETRQELLTEEYALFTSSHDSILNENDIPGTYYDTFNNYRDTYAQYRTAIKEKMIMFDSSCTPSQPTAKREDSVRLPRIELPTFNGNYIEWITFRDLFISLVHNNTQIGNVNKCQYLKASLKDEAEYLVKHIAISEDNYKVMWDILQKRYENRRLIIHNYLKKLVRFPTIKQECAKSIKNLLDNTNECLVSLKNFKVPTDTWDCIVTYIVLEKLDLESHKLFEDSLQGVSDFPTWVQLSSFLEKRFKTLEILRDAQTKSQIKAKVHSLEYSEAESNKAKMCAYCKDTDHIISHCKKFGTLDINKRRNYIQQNSLCFNCLRTGHNVSKCIQSTNCRICSRRHHTLLHQKQLQVTSITNEEPLSGTKEQDPTNQFISLNQQASNNVMLATALVNVEINSQVFTLRALIDPGSQASLISEAVCHHLRLQKSKVNTIITGVNSSKTATKSAVTFTIKSIHTEYNLNVYAYVMKSLTSFIPSTTHAIDWPQLKELCLADPHFQQPDRIDLILGADVYAHIIQPNLIKANDNKLLAQNTHLGWIVSGQTNDRALIHNHVMVNHCLDLQKFWEIENVETKCKSKILTKDEQKCEDHFVQTLQRSESGRYKVKLPFCTRPPELGDSKEIAMKRQLGVERRLHKSPHLREQYNCFMQDYIDQGHMKLCTDNSSMNNYLPHHPVINPSHLTTKLRVVFDGSARTSNGKSLNDNLLIGPSLQSDIRNIILRWRRHKIVIVGDIRQMYRQIVVDDKDSNYQRILWRFDEKDPIQSYKLTTVTYGTSCAPFLAIRTLQQLIDDEKSNFTEDIIDIAKEDFYVDDFISGSSSDEKAINIKTDITNLFSRGGFALHKWSSNSKLIPNDTPDIRQILGLTWDSNTDTFQMQIILPDNREGIHTKRTILSDIAKLYDPAGWLSPVIITAKIILQRLWLSKLDWDERLPLELETQYKTYRKELNAMPIIKLDRWIESPYKIANPKIELHGFCDASTLAYSAVVYYRYISSDSTKVTMLEAKTKVAPVKQLSLPRLELCGAVLLAKLLDHARLNLNVPIGHVYAWTDSEIVLAWLQRHPNYWETFVANRVSEITMKIDSTQWHHVPSKENPADVASRGIAPKDLSNHLLWWHGPHWLHTNHEINVTKGEDLKETTLELKNKYKPTNIKVNTCKCSEVNMGNLNSEVNKDNSNNIVNKDNFNNIVITNNKQSNNLSDKSSYILQCYSSLTKLIRVVAYCLRFVSKEKTSFLTTKELNYALMKCIKLSQVNNFHCDITNIQQKCTRYTSKLTSLHPFLDKDNVLRVGDRISKSLMSESIKHPIILSNDEFAKLIVYDAHIKTLHGNVRIMMSFIRSKYWIIKVKNLVKECVRKCVTCCRFSAKPMTQLMGNLPEVRVTPQRPFLISGVDFAGPITLKVGKGRWGCQKAYISLFICTSVKAIHLELVTGLDSECFIAAFRRFTSRRGHCRQLLSDRGTNFVGASKILKFNESQSKVEVPLEIVESLANDGTDWIFNPGNAPHMGGLWEAAVKSTKYHLNRVTNGLKLTFEEFSTLLCQIESCLNSRPLTIDHSIDDPNEISVLTPGHFLIGEAPIVTPDTNLCHVKVSYNNRWMFLQQKLQEFWKRWHMEYLTTLQKRSKWTTESKQIQLNDIVLVIDDRYPPSKWCIGKVVTLHPGSDNLIRVVSVKCKSTVLKRPIHKICLLPVN